MTASILDGSLVIWTLRIASSIVGGVRQRCRRPAPGCTPDPRWRSGPGVPSGARNPASSRAARPCVADQQADQIVDAATVAGSVDGRHHRVVERRRRRCPGRHRDGRGTAVGVVGDHGLFADRHRGVRVGGEPVEQFSLSPVGRSGRARPHRPGQRRPGVGGAGDRGAGGQDRGDRGGRSRSGRAARPGSGSAVVPVARMSATSGLPTAARRSARRRADSANTTGLVAIDGSGAGAAMPRTRAARDPHRANPGSRRRRPVRRSATSPPGRRASPRPGNLRADRRSRPVPATTSAMSGAAATVTAPRRPEQPVRGDAARSAAGTGSGAMRRPCRSGTRSGRGDGAGGSRPGAAVTVDRCDLTSQVTNPAAATIATTRARMLIARLRLPVVRWCRPRVRPIRWLAVLDVRSSRRCHPFRTRRCPPYSARP